MTSTVPAAIRAAAANHRRQRIEQIPLIRPGDVRAATTLPGDVPATRRLVLVTAITCHTEYVSCAGDMTATEPQAELVHCLPLAADGDWDGGPPLSRWALPSWLLLAPADELLVWPAAVVPMPFRVLPGQLATDRYAHLDADLRRAAWRTVVDPADEAPGRVAWQGRHDARRTVIDVLFADLGSIGRHATHVEFADLDNEPHRDGCPCSMCAGPSGRIVVPTLARCRSRADAAAGRQPEACSSPTGQSASSSFVSSSSAPR